MDWKELDLGLGWRSVGGVTREHERFNVMVLTRISSITVLLASTTSCTLNAGHVETILISMERHMAVV